MLHFPYLPPLWIFIPGSAAIAALLVLLYLRSRPAPAARPRNLLTTLRMITVALILFCICHPIYRVFSSEKFQGLVAVVLDASASMALPDEAGGLTRFEKAVRNLAGPETDLVAALGDKFRLRTYTLAEDAKETKYLKAAKPAGRRTNIAGGLTTLLSALSAETVSGVVLCSDGVDNSRQDMAPVAEAFAKNGVPIHTALAGGKVPIKDIGIKSVQTQREVTLETVVAVRVTLQSSGYKDAKVPVQLKRGQQVVKTVEVVLAGGPQTADFVFTPEEVGLLQYDIIIPVQTGEQNTANNTETFAVNASKHKIKILYMEGTQYRMPDREKWEFQYLVEALEEDKHMEVTPLFRNDFNAAKQAGISCVRDPANGFPTTKKKLYHYDVIICSDIDSVFFTPQQLKDTVTFVGERGGGYIMIGGYTAFGPGGYGGSVIDKMLPVEMAGREDGYTEDVPFQWELTDDGKKHPVMQLDPDPAKNADIWKAMPFFNGFNHIKRAKPGATVLAVHPTRKSVYGPMVMLAVQQYGKGRTVAFCTDTTAGWGQEFEAHWGLTETDNSYFRKFWQNIVRWAAAYHYRVPNSPVLITTDFNRYSPGDRARISASVVDENYKPADDAETWVHIRQPDEKVIRLPLTRDVDQPGQYTARYEVPAIGQYELKAGAKLKGEIVGEDAARFFAKETDIEARDYEPNKALLTSLAAQTGGISADIARTSEIAERLKASTHEEQTYIERALWDNRYFFCLILGLLGVEWFLRRREGLA